MMTNQTENPTSLTNDQIEALLDEIGCGACVEDLTWTQETIADWINSSAGWAERRGYELDECDGYPYVLFERAQVRKGQPRTDIYVVDFGDVRGVYA